MADNKTFKLLPEVFQTETQRKFFESTFEQLFSEKDSEKVDGFVGRRLPGNYDPINDYFLQQPSKERTYNMLEPMSVSSNNDTLEISNVATLADMSNRLTFLKGETANKDRLYSTEYYTFAPPIDIDKFINYYVYFWVNPMPVAEISNLSDYDIENDIIGKEAYTYNLNETTDVNFTNGLVINFSGSSSYKKDYIVQGVGTSIYLIEALAGTGTEQDYIVIEPGAENDNGWSNNNHWVHKDTIAAQILLLGDSTEIVSEQAKRPIIEFNKELELYDFGNYYKGAVDFATETKFESWNGFPTTSFPDINAGDTYIFLNDVNTNVSYSNVNSFYAEVPGYSFKLSTPFTDMSDMFVLVKRPLDLSGTNYELFFDPTWYNREDETNILSFTTQTPRSPDEVFNDFGTGNKVQFTMTLVDITDPTKVTVNINGTQINDDDYSYELNSITSVLTVLFDVAPGSGTTVDFTVSDLIEGLIDGSSLTVDEQDIVEVHLQSNVTKYTEEVTTPVNEITFNIGYEATDDDVLAINVSDVSGVTVYDYLPGVSDNSVIADVSYTPTAVIVSFNSNLATGDDVALYTTEKTAINYAVNDYRWEADTYNDIITFSPFPSQDDVLSPGDAVIVDQQTSTVVDDVRYYKNNQNIWAIASKNNKQSINQAPLFNLYYTMLDDGSNPVELDNNDYFNASSTFTGSEIFSYKVDEQSPLDPYLGFGLEYKNLGQTADIVFEHDLQTNRYSYTDAEGELVEIPGYYYYRNVSGKNEGYGHTWVPSDGKSKLRVVDLNVIQDLDVKSYLLSVTPDINEHGIYDVNAQLQTTKLEIGPVPTEFEEPTWDFYIDFDTNNNPYAVLTDNANIELNDVLEFRTYSLEALDPAARGVYEVPVQLESNPNNEEVEEYTSNEFAQHFTSIIENQDGFEGNGFGSNNYRDTEQNLARGSFILQTKGTVLKGLLSTSDEDYDIVNAIRFSKTEYTRYKDRFVKAAGQLIKEAWTPTDLPYITSNEQMINEIIERVSSTVEYFGAFEKSYMLNWGNNGSTEVFKSSLFINPAQDEKAITASGLVMLTTVDNITDPANGILLFKDDVMQMRDIDYTIVSGSNIQLLNYNEAIDNEYQVRIFENTSPSYIPSSPSFLGLYQTYFPSIKFDDSYVTPVYVIVGHDGTRTPMYTSEDNVNLYFSGYDSLDLRDVALLGLEQRIYNNTLDLFREEYVGLYSEYDVTPGQFRVTEYTVDEYNDIFISDFLKWAQRINANYKIHNEFDVADWKTWNYKSNNPLLPGNWKGMFEYVYDCIEPGKRPWEMLGFSIQPTWWETVYGIDYGSNNTAMWEDLEQGVIVQGSRQGIDLRFARPGLASIIPVDALGAIIAPHVIGIANEPADEDKDAPWEFGDSGPVETAWRNSSNFRFTTIENEFLMHPGLFSEIKWDASQMQAAPIQPLQIVSFENFTRKSNSELYVHGEVVNGVTQINFGYQRYIADLVEYTGKDITVDYGAFLRNLNVKLGHRFAGFTNQDTLRVLVEGTSAGSSNASLTVPNENINVTVHKGKTLKEYVYSGVMVRINEDGEFQVNGYDILTPEFRMYGRSKQGKANQLTVGGTPKDFADFVSGNTYYASQYVRYNTRFYISNTNQTVDKFTDGDWTAAAELPTVGGIEVSYNATPDYSNEIIVEYGSTFTDEQMLFDFLVGYGDWLENEGWVFDNIDTDLNVRQDWLNSARDVLFWATTTWAEGNTIYVSPGSEKINLEVVEGYPDNVERITNGVYSIIDTNGIAIAPEDTLINRNRQRIEVSHKNESVGIYSLRVSAKETEHVIILDNKSVFNDVIYDPLIMSRQNKIELFGYRSLNWYGKFEADGYLIRDNKLIQNYENLTSSFRDYYNEQVTLDNPNIEDVARHLIGYQNRDYLENLKMYDDTQYQFYKGMLPEKGTIQPVDKILRSDFIRSDSDIQIYEDWAFKAGEFGAVNDNATLEFLFEQDSLKTDPQLVFLSYPQGPVDSGYISDIKITNAETFYTEAPDVAITSPVDPDGTTAVARAIISSKGILESIEVVVQGSGYSAAPDVQIVVNGVETKDTAISLLKYEVSVADRNSEDVVFDIDDTDKWLTRPFGRNYDNFVPQISLEETITPVQNAGYVNLNDVDFAAYNSDIWQEIIAAHDPDAGWDTINYTWLADADMYGKKWTVAKYEEPATNENANIPNNNLSGHIAFDYTIYSYEPLHANFVYDITSVTDLQGNTKSVSNTDDTADIYLPETRVALLTHARYNSVTEAENESQTKYWADTNQGNGWYYTDGTTTRKQEVLIDTKMFKSAFVYESDTDQTIAHIPVYDPFKGIIPGIAERNIVYKSTSDPARYTANSDAQESVVNDNLSFNEKQVGQLWWDTSTAKYLYYEQGDSEYRKNNWGKLFPGATVDMYEWVRSPYVPAEYDGTGTARNETDYSVKSEFNSKFNTYDTYYYYWVKDKTTVPDNLSYRSMSALNVSRLLQDPRNQGFQWYSFVSSNEFVFNNISLYLKDRESVFQINYSFAETENDKHVEWKLISEGNPESDVTDQFWDKMVDSITEYDKNGNLVPNPSLSSHEILGIKKHPVQTMFKDVYGARKVFVESVNPLLAPVNLRDQVNWDSSLLSTNVYWSFVDWYKDGYDASNTVPALQVDSGRNEPEGSPPPPSLTNDQENALSDGNIVKVYEKDNSAYYEYSEASNSATVLVRREKTAMEIKDTIYSAVVLTSLSTELREIFNVLRTIAFVNDNLVNQNILFFSLVNYVSYEQPNVDWFFKTTYLDVIQAGQSLSSQPRFYRNDVGTSFVDYLNEVKPYQCKIRDYSVTLGAAIDDVLLSAYDMDQLAYTTDEQGDTIPVTDPAYDPFDVPRYMNIFSTYDDVQCGFVDKEVFLDIGNQSVFTDITNTDYIFAVTPEHFNVTFNNRVLVEGTEYTLSKTDDLRLVVELTSNLGKGLLKVEEYQVADGFSTTYTFKSAPNVHKLFIIKDEGDDLGSSYLVPKENYDASYDPDTYLLTLTFINPTIEMVTTGRIIKIISGATFTHTAIEEMRLMYNTYRYQSDASIEPNVNTTDVRFVTFDVDVLEHDTFTGWGTTEYGNFFWGTDDRIDGTGVTRLGDQLPWNADADGKWNSTSWNQSASKVASTSHSPVFVMYSGVANRYMQMQGASITGPVFKFPVNDNVINYSSYTERQSANAVTQAERDALESFNLLYKEKLVCDFDGIYIDAEDFNFVNTQQWDSESWGSAPWDARTQDEIITPDIPDDTDLVARYVSDGVLQILRMPYVVDVSEVLADEVPITYDITQGLTDTIIDVQSVYPQGTVFLVTYTHTGESFDNDNSLPGIDGGFFAPQQYDAGVTQELAVYNVTEGLVLTYYFNSGDDLYPDGTFSGYREFVSEEEITEFISIEPETTTKLLAPVDMHDKIIEVEDTAKLGTASFEIPGIAWIGSERITFTNVDSATQISGITRRTGGTTTDMSLSATGTAVSDYAIGKLVFKNELINPPQIDIVVEEEPPVAPSLWYGFDSIQDNTTTDDVWVNKGADQTNDYNLSLLGGAEITSVPERVDGRPSITNDVVGGWLNMETNYDMSHEDRTMIIAYRKRGADGYLTSNRPQGNNSAANYVSLDSHVDSGTNKVGTDFAYGSSNKVVPYYQNSQPYQEPCWDANANRFTKAEVLDIATNGGMICYYTGQEPDGTDGYVVLVSAVESEFQAIYDDWTSSSSYVWVRFQEVSNVVTSSANSYVTDIDWITITVTDLTNTVSITYGSNNTPVTSVIDKVGATAVLNGFLDSEEQADSMIGEIYEIMVYGRSLSDTDLARVNYYMSEKWGPYMNYLDVWVNPDPDNGVFNTGYWDDYAIWDDLHYWNDGV